MILADTSVWVDHLRRTDAHLAEFLADGEIACHPFVIGELACGHPTRRREILSLLAALPQAPVVDHEEAVSFLNRFSLSGSDLGWVDVHLLASAVLARIPLLTRGRRLAEAARRMGIA